MASDPYASERSAPTLPTCGRSPLSLHFDGRQLTLRGSAGASVAARSYPADSGRPDDRGRFDYGVDRQKKSDEGPIPAGTYWINPSEMWERAWWKFGMAQSWGDFRITIHIHPNTKSHGRGGFFIHGGAARGSAGCIDLTNHMSRFVADLRASLTEGDECYIPLTVSYPPVRPPRKPTPPPRMR